MNVLIGVTEPPFPFDRINGLPLDGWTGEPGHSGFARLVETLDAQVAKADAAARGTMGAALKQRQAKALQAQEQLSAAEGAFQAAQAQEGTARDEEALAQTTHRAAEAQLRQVAKINASAAILKAAHEELDRTQAALEAAKARRSQTQAAVAEASRGLAQARAELAQAGGPTDARPPKPAPPTAAAPVRPSWEDRQAAKAARREERAERLRKRTPLEKALPYLFILGIIAIAMVTGRNRGWPPYSHKPASAAGEACASVATPPLNLATAFGKFDARTAPPDAMRMVPPPALQQAEFGALMAGDKTRAVALARLRVEHADLGGEVTMAKALAEGWAGVTEPDPAAARSLYQNAADNHDPGAYAAVAGLFEQGASGVTMNMAAARCWYRKAADAGDAAAEKWLDDHPG